MLTKSITLGDLYKYADSSVQLTRLGSARVIHQQAVPAAVTLEVHESRPADRRLGASGIATDPGDFHLLVPGGTVVLSKPCNELWIRQPLHGSAGINKGAYPEMYRSRVLLTSTPASELTDAAIVGAESRVMLSVGSDLPMPGGDALASKQSSLSLACVEGNDGTVDCVDSVASVGAGGAVDLAAPWLVTTLEHVRRYKRMMLSVIAYPATGAAETAANAQDVGAIVVAYGIPTAALSYGDMYIGTTGANANSYARARIHLGTPSEAVAALRSITPTVAQFFNDKAARAMYLHAVVVLDDGEIRPRRTVEQASGELASASLANTLWRSLVLPTTAGQRVRVEVNITTMAAGVTLECNAVSGADGDDMSTAVPFSTQTLTTVGRHIFDVDAAASSTALAFQSVGGSTTFAVHAELIAAE